MKKLLLTLAISLSIALTVHAQLPVIPCGEGFGIYTPGGSGRHLNPPQTTVYKVTNLNNSGTGSLRAALESNGPRVVVFEKSGIIDLQDSPIYIANPYITIAGQTAPSPGILVKGGNIIVQTHDVLIQHIAVRLGAGTNESNVDACSVLGFESDVYNVVIDHVSMSWASDEVISTYHRDYGVNDITISNCLIAEAFEYGFLIGDGSTNVSVLKNIIMSHSDRLPLQKAGTSAVIANNLIYNWTIWSPTSVGANDEGQGAALSSIAGNYYKLGPGSSTTAFAVKCESSAPSGTKIYLSDNLRSDGNANLIFNYTTSFDPRVSTPPVWPALLNLLPASQVESHCISYAGSRPGQRDPVDSRLINDIQSGTGQHITSESQVGGYPSLAQNSRVLTLPANPSGDNDADGYTNLENWLIAYTDTVEGFLNPCNSIPCSGFQTNIIPSGTVTAVTGDTVLLNAGSGFTDYQWSDGATTQIISVTQPGNFWVSVNGGDGCSDTSEVVYVKFFQPFAICIEAETSTLTSPMALGSDTSASGNAYIYPATGTNSISPAAEATLNFSVPDTATYYLWLRMMGPDPSSDALYIGIDNSWDRVFPTTQGVYEWLPIKTAQNTTHYEFNLSAGTHTVQIGHGEINARADAVYITNRSKETPSGECTINTSLIEPDSKTLIVFPNPASGTLKITSSSFALPASSLKVFDISGRKVMETALQNANEIQLDVSGLSDGVYFIKVSSGMEVIITKFVKQ